jgi:hypothetical protein
VAEGVRTPHLLSGSVLTHFLSNLESIGFFEPSDEEDLSDEEEEMGESA